MKKNLLREKMNHQPVPLNGWSTGGGIAAVEAMAVQPWDALTIDMQHGIGDFETTVNMLRAISTTDVVPMVRVPWMEPGIVMRVLDAGAYGIICPMINTAEQCQAFVSACRYAPLGTRSFGPTRANHYAGADYWTRANETVLTFAMVETRQAVDNLAEILAVEGLDGVYVGPADLSLSLGFHPVDDQAHPEVLAVMESIRTAALAAGKFAVVHCAAISLAQIMLDKNWSMLTVSNDLRFLTVGQQQMFELLRAQAAPPARPSY
jgi:4-hydroxy-2-oxoheptanedioate aldolase